MGLFVCSKCNCVENTALGNYWGRNYHEWFCWDKDNEQFKGKPLCSECAPKYYSDGKTSTDFGKWHNKFPKENYDDIPEKEKEGIYPPEKR